jgi:hypothetical protein
MTVTEVDHQAVKNRIVEMFKADTGIWNENNPLGRARSIDLGVPDGKQWLDIPTPYIRITNAPDLESDKPFGSLVSGQTSASYHIVKYLIMVVDQSKDAKTVEATLDNLHKAIKENLKENSQLTDPDDSSDAKCKMSHPIRTEQLQAGSFKGKSVDGFVLTLQCEMTT